MKTVTTIAIVIIASLALSACAKSIRDCNVDSVAKEYLEIHKKYGFKTAQQWLNRTGCQQP